MCGIVGIFSNEENKSATLKKMTDKIAHRGPDGEGYYEEEAMALGHRRLAIIDINKGKQPMISEDKQTIVVFNGEIYNYKELQEELEEKGHKFITNSDTEILIHGYEEWKKQLPKKLRGMFAFAIWDKKNQTLFCARDPFGIKPFYYYKKEKIFLFASEIKAFLEHPEFEKVLNKELLASYLSFSFTPTVETFFKDVFCLEPGNSLTFQNNQIEIQPYFKIQFEEKQQDFHKMVEQISNTVKNSIHYHMISDVEVGAFLSSGIDSSYIVSLAKPDKTYTVGYHSLKYSEIEYAKDLSQKLEIKNTSIAITKEEYMNAVEKMLYYMDEPFCDPAAVSLYLISKEASKEVKVILSGEGADEFFGGYNTYKEEIDYQFYHKIPFFLRHFVAKLFEILPEGKGRNFIVRNGKRIEEDYVGVNKILSEKEVKKIIAFKKKGNSQEITKPIFEQYKKQNNITKMQAIDIKFWLTKDILLKADKMTMANSIEARTPFVDKKVFEIASTLPMQYKVSKNNTKVALRQAAKQAIPNDAYKKKKLGFPVPLREWVKEDDMYHKIKDSIKQEWVAEFFNQKYVLHLLEQHKNNKKDNYKKVWAVYCFIKWYEIYFRN